MLTSTTPVIGSQERYNYYNQYNYHQLPPRQPPRFPTHVRRILFGGGGVGGGGGSEPPAGESSQSQLSIMQQPASSHWHSSRASSSSWDASELGLLAIACMLLCTAGCLVLLSLAFCRKRNTVFVADTSAGSSAVRGVRAMERAARQEMVELDQMLADMASSSCNWTTGDEEDEFDDDSFCDRHFLDERDEESRRRCLNNRLALADFATVDMTNQQHEHCECIGLLPVQKLST